MSELQDQQNQIEMDIDGAKEVIDRADAMLRLLDNADFNLLVEEGYFRDEAARLCNVKADPEFEDKESQRNLQRNIDAIAPLRVYFRTILQFGDMARQALESDEATREELLEEEAGE